MKKLNNCKIVDGSLTIANIKDQTIRNLSFPSLIEVTGYLEILNNDYLLSAGIFPNLSIIRGKILKESTALEISGNENIVEIGLKSLKVVYSGNVRIRNNKNLCFADTVDWSVIAVNSTGNEIEVG